MSVERQRALAKELDELAMAIPQVVQELQQGVGDELAYALLYHLRWEIGQLVSHAGRSGSPSAERRQEAMDIMNAARLTETVRRKSG